jgi:DNA invertase Pin-like site-specific DNA recombinase
MHLGSMRVSKADGSQGLDLQRDTLRAGDVLVVWKLDRLGRDLRHLINTVHDLTTQGISLKVPTGHGAGLDTTTVAGKLVSLNLLHFVARQTWLRSCVSPRRLRAHRVQRDAPL